MSMLKTNTVWRCDTCDLTIRSQIPNCICGLRKPQPEMKDGDWECPNCGDVCFADKVYCPSCSYRKHDGMPKFKPLTLFKNQYTPEGKSIPQPEGIYLQFGRDILTHSMTRTLEKVYYNGYHTVSWASYNSCAYRSFALDWKCPNCGYHVHEDKDCRCGTPNPNTTSRQQHQNKKGDWNCQKCGDKVFASRSVCRCGEPKSNDVKVPTTCQTKKGDWNCPKCNDLVFASKSVCRCGEPKPSDVKMTSSDTTSTSRAKKGDWNCPNCNDLVFASKSVCRCGEPKPDSLKSNIPSSTTNIQGKKG
jgi:hypothetical protein